MCVLAVTQQFLPVVAIAVPLHLEALVGPEGGEEQGNLVVEAVEFEVVRVLKVGGLEGEAFGDDPALVERAEH